MKSALIGVLALALLSVVGCEEKPAPAPTDMGSTPTVPDMDRTVPVLLTAVNSNCPYSGKAVDAQFVSATAAGVNVGFCCKGCKAKFEMLDEAGQAALVAKLPAALGAPGSTDPHAATPPIPTGG